MKATIVDLRYKMNDVLKALRRREKVTILYHGKVKGTIIPVCSAQNKKVADHPFFGMCVKDKRPVVEVMKTLRESRYRDI